MILLRPEQRRQPAFACERERQFRLVPRRKIAVYPASTRKRKKEGNTQRGREASAEPLPTDDPRIERRHRPRKKKEEATGRAPNAGEQARLSGCISAGKD